jgi:hypothetical protein
MSKRKRSYDKPSMFVAWKEIVQEGEDIARRGKKLLTEPAPNLSLLRKGQRKMKELKTTLRMLYRLRTRAKQIATERWLKREQERIAIIAAGTKIDEEFGDPAKTMRD